MCLFISSVCMCVCFLSLGKKKKQVRQITDFLMCIPMTCRFKELQITALNIHVKKLVNNLH